MKQSYTQKITLLFALFLSMATSFAQTGNDCANAIPVTVNVNSCQYEIFDNVGLTNSGQIPGVCSQLGYSGGDLWLSAVVPPSGELTCRTSLNIDDFNGLFDLAAAAYSGTCGSLTQIACAADGIFGYPTLTVTGTPGSTVYFQMWEEDNNQTNTFRVCMEGTPTCTEPDVIFTRTCAGNNEYEVSVNIVNMGSEDAIDLTVNGDVVISGITETGSYIVGPYPLDFDFELEVVPTNDVTCTVTEQITSDGLGCEYVLTCGTVLEQDYCYGNDDHNIFLYSSPSGSPITITFTSGLIQSPQDRIFIVNGPPGQVAPEILFQGSNFGNLTGLTRTASTGTIYIQVDSDFGGSCVDGSLGLGAGWTWTVTCEASMCDEATNIVSQTTFAASEVSGDLAGQTYSGFAQCGETNNENPDQFFTFTAVGSVQYIRVNASGDFDPVVQVYDACDGTPIACVNDAGPGQRELFWLTDLTIGQEYAYQVFNNGVGNASTTAYETAVAHIPTVQLRPQDCGSTGLLANSIIRSTWPNPNFLLDGFIWEFTELEEPFNVYEVNSPNGANPQFRIYWFTDYEYGRSYSVRIKARMYQGPNVGEYGPACTISMASGVTTALQPQFDGGDFQFCTNLRAVPVTGATNYRWEFTDTQTADVFTYNSNTSNYFCPLQNVSGLQMSAQYAVDVFVTVNGVESTESTTRTINTVLPTTVLNPAFVACGSSVNITQSAQAFNVCAAESYTFRFTNVSQPELPVLTKVRPNRVIVFNTVAGLIPGDTYDVGVSALVGGETTPYGTEPCLITINALSGIVGQEDGLQLTDGNEGIMPALSIYPNPITDNNSQVLISVMDMSSSQQQIEVRVFDMSGRLMTSQNYGNNGSSFNAILNLDDEMATGVYIVTTTVNGAPLKTEKLIVE